MFIYRRLVAETEEALKEQDERLGKVLGRLQVSSLIYLGPKFSPSYYRPVQPCQRVDQGLSKEQCDSIFAELLVEN